MKLEKLKAACAHFVRAFRCHRGRPLLFRIRAAVAYAMCRSGFRLKLQMPSPKAKRAYIEWERGGSK